MSDLIGGAANELIQGQLGLIPHDQPTSHLVVILPAFCPQTEQEYTRLTISVPTGADHSPLRKVPDMLCVWYKNRPSIGPSRSPDMQSAGWCSLQAGLAGLVPGGARLSFRHSDWRTARPVFAVDRKIEVGNASAEASCERRKKPNRIVRRGDHSLIRCEEAK